MVRCLALHWFALALAISTTFTCLAAAPARADSSNGPVASYSVPGSGSVSVQWGLVVTDPGTVQPIQHLNFGNVSSAGTHFDYVDIMCTKNSSSGLLAKYSVNWKAQPAGMSVSLQILNGTWSDLNDSALILQPGASTMIKPHVGFPSAARVLMQTSNSLASGGYNLVLTVFGFAINPSPATLSQSTVGMQSAATYSSAVSNFTSSSVSNNLSVSPRQSVSPQLISEPGIQLLEYFGAAMLAIAAVGLFVRFRKGLKRRVLDREA